MSKVAIDKVVDRGLDARGVRLSSTQHSANFLSEI